MNCFNHQKISAIGSCRNCSKGLCSECFNIVEDCLVCKNDYCKQTFVENIELNNRAKKTYMIGKKNKKLFTPRIIIYLSIGAFFLGGYALYAESIYDENNLGSFMVGITFILASLYLMFKKDRFNF